MPRHRIALTSLVLLTAATAASLLYASDGFAVTYPATEPITAFDECRTVTNNSPTGLSVYVPAQSPAEWQSFRDHPPAGVTLDSCVTPGSQIFSTPGTYSFVVPPFTSLTVKVWGAGGGGSIGAPGGDSSFNATVIARGGQPATNLEPYYGLGGTASGGDTNITGGNGEYYSTDSPAPRCDYSGGEGGNAPAGGGVGGQSGACTGCAGQDGEAPGSGGGGGASRTCYIGSSGSACGCGSSHGGGAGGYTIKTYAPGELPVGASITVVVGAGGVGRIAASGSVPNASWNYGKGGDGANGRVEITWE